MSKKQVLKYFRAIAKEADISMTVDSKVPIADLALELTMQGCYVDYIKTHEGNFKYCGNDINTVNNVEDVSKEIESENVVTVNNGIATVNITMASDIALTDQYLDMLFDNDTASGELNEVSVNDCSNIVSEQGNDTCVDDLDFDTISNNLDLVGDIEGNIFGDETEFGIDGEDIVSEGIDNEDIDDEDIDNEDIDGEDLVNEDIASEDIDNEDIGGEDIYGDDIDNEDIDGEDIDGEDIDGEDIDGEGIDVEDTASAGIDGEDTDGAGIDGEDTDGEDIAGEDTDGEGIDGEDIANEDIDNEDIVNASVPNVLNSDNIDITAIDFDYTDNSCTNTDLLEQVEDSCENFENYSYDDIDLDDDIDTDMGVSVNSAESAINTSNEQVDSVVRRNYDINVLSDFVDVGDDSDTVLETAENTVIFDGIDGTDNVTRTHRRRLNGDISGAAILLNSVNNDSDFDTVNSEFDVDDTANLLSNDVDNIDGENITDAENITDGENRDVHDVVTDNGGMDSDGVETAYTNRRNRRLPRAREADFMSFGISGGTSDVSYCNLSIDDDIEEDNNGLSNFSLSSTHADTFSDLSPAAQMLCGFDVNVVATTEIIPTMDLVQAIMKVAETVDNVGKSIVGGVKKVFGAIKGGINSNTRNSHSVNNVMNEEVVAEPVDMSFLDNEPIFIDDNAVQQGASVNTLNDLYDIFGYDSMDGSSAGEQVSNSVTGDNDVEFLASEENRIEEMPIEGNNSNISDYNDEQFESVDTNVNDDNDTDVNNNIVNNSDNTSDDFEISSEGLSFEDFDDF